MADEKRTIKGPSELSLIKDQRSAHVRIFECHLYGTREFLGGLFDDLLKFTRFVAVFSESSRLKHATFYLLFVKSQLKPTANFFFFQMLWI